MQGCESDRETKSSTISDWALSAHQGHSRLLAAALQSFDRLPLHRLITSPTGNITYYLLIYLLLCAARREAANDCDEYTRLSSCLSVHLYISKTAWSWLGPLLAALRYVMYFRFCGWRHCLARSAKLLTGLYILPSVISFFFLNWAKLSQDLLDRFLRFFYQMEGISVNVVNSDHFFDSSRDVAMATNFGQNWRNDLHSAPWHFKRGGISQYG